MPDLLAGRITEWYGARRRWQQILGVAGFGALAAIGQAPFDLPVALLIGFIAVFALFPLADTPKRAALWGVAFGSGYFALTLMWIVEPFFVDAPRYGWMAPFALVFLSVGLALFWGLAFGVARWFGHGAGMSALILAITLTAAEVIRAYIFTGFPWGMPAQALVNGIMGQAAAWVGPHGLNLLLFIGVVVVAQVGPKIAKTIAFAALIAVVLWPLPEIIEPAQQDGRIIRMIQPNAPQDEKWDPQRIPVFYQRQITLTGAAPIAGAPRPNLVIWSETALPTLLQYAEKPLREIARAAGGAPVVLGVQRLAGRRMFNSLIVVTPEGQVSDQYDKHHLVPFGEYLPMAKFLARFGLRGLAASDGSGFSAGEGPALVNVPGFGRAMPLICYEAVFPQDVNNAPERPDFLMQITNDAWFGEFSGPYQHLAIARMRAIEQGLPMVRVANTGVSAMIDARGRITASIALGTSGFADAVLPPALAATLYSRTKDWAIIVLLIVVLGALRLNARFTRMTNRD